MAILFPGGGVNPQYNMVIDSRIELGRTEFLPALHTIPVPSRSHFNKFNVPGFIRPTVLDVDLIFHVIKRGGEHNMLFRRQRVAVGTQNGQRQDPCGGVLFRAGGGDEEKGRREEL